MASTLVLSVGLDPHLLGTRNLVLQFAGYAVVPAFSIREAFDCLRAGDFDLVLLCQSIPADERDRLSLWIRASGSRAPVVSVSGKLRQSEPFAGVTVDGDPDALLMGIREVLFSAATPAVRTPASCHKKDAGGLPPKEAAGAEGKRQPQSATGYERQGRTTNERTAPLAGTG